MKRPHSGHLLVKMWQGWGPSSYIPANIYGISR